MRRIYNPICALFLASGVVALASEYGCFNAVADEPSTQTYPIDFSPTRKLDRRRRVRGRIIQEVEQVVTKGGAELKRMKRKTRIEFTAVIQTLLVDRRGAETEAMAKIEKFIASDETGPVFELDAGNIVMARTQGRHVIYQLAEEDNPLPKQLAIYVRPMFEVLFKEMPTDNQIFGTDEPRPVGGSWRADKPQLLTLLRYQVSTELVERDVAGKAELAAVRNVRGAVVVDLKYSIALRGRASAVKLPGFSPIKNTVQSTSILRLPADYHSGWIKRRSKTRAQGAYAGKFGGPTAGVTMHIVATSSAEFAAEYLQGD